MNEAITLNIVDLDTEEAVCLIVQFSTERVVIALSTIGDGDCQVVMDKAQAKQLLQALQLAVS